MEEQGQVGVLLLGVCGHSSHALARTEINALQEKGEIFIKGDAGQAAKFELMPLSPPTNLWIILNQESTLISKTLSELVG